MLFSDVLMQEVASYTNLHLFSEINDPVLSVKFLPDVISSSNHIVRKSAVVQNQTNLLQKRYAVEVAEYDDGFKSIVFETNKQLESVAKKCKDRIDKEITLIETHLVTLEKCTSPDYYLSAWDFVAQKVTTIFSDVNNLGRQFIMIEEERLNCVKTHMQDYYIGVHDHCYSDKEKLTEFFEKEIFEFNTSVIRNYQAYANTIARLKTTILQKFFYWHDIWEIELFSWRDHCIKENIKKINLLSTDDSFLNPDEIEFAREKCVSSVKHIGTSVDELINQLATIMPVTIGEGVQAFDKIGEILHYGDSLVDNYKQHVGKIFDKKFCYLTKKIGEMSGYLNSSSVFEKNNSLELFEYSIFSICEEFEKRIAENQKKYMEEIDHSFLAKQKECEEHKDHIFQGCNAWGLYLQGYEFAYKVFTNKFDLSLKSHNNNVIWLEKSLNKYCSALAECRTFKQLEKKMEDVSQQLDRIFGEYERYQSVLDEHLECYLKEWVGMEEGLNTDLFSAIHVRLATPNSLPNTTFTVKKKVYEYYGNPTYLQLKLKCAKKFVKRLTVQQGLHLEDLKTKLTNQIKQAHYEVQIRKELHKPRLSIVRRDIYNVRLNEITAFKEDCEGFWNEVTSGEQRYTRLINKLIEDVDIVVKSSQEDSEKAKEKMKIIDTSEELQSLLPIIQGKASERITELCDLVDEYNEKINSNKDAMTKTLSSIFEKSNLKGIKVSNDQKLRNEYEEFLELTDDMMENGAQEKSKVLHIEQHEDKAIQFYKHSLFGAFYMEKKTEILKECRLRIKTASVCCTKEVAQFEVKKKKFTCKKICTSFEKNTAFIDQFSELYSMAKSIINQLNYSSGIGENLAQCVSMEKLHRRYVRFGGGQSRALDSAFIKEIKDCTSTTKSMDNESESKAPRDEFYWKISRIKVFKELIGKFKCKYGVGVRAELEKSDHNLSLPRMKVATLKRYGIHSSPDNYWASHLLGKKGMGPSKEEHDSIVAKACAKLRDKQNSRANRKSFQSCLPLLKEKQLKGVSINRTRDCGSSNYLPQIEESEPMKVTNALAKTLSVEQVDMDGAVRLSRTIEFLLGTRQVPSRGSSISSDEQDRDRKFYDFMTTPDDVMKKMIFDPVSFFSFRKRCLDVDATAKQIVSIPEKTKYFLRYAIEQFILSSEVFYRQKNLFITWSHIPKDIDLACKDMETELQLYLDNIMLFCADAIKKMKAMAHELISHQEKFITSLFSSVTKHLNEQDKEFMFNTTEKFRAKKQEIEKDQNALLFQLKAHMAHPNYHHEVYQLQEIAEQLSEKCAEDLRLFHSDTLKFIEFLNTKALADIKSYKQSMYNLADCTIHPSKVKRITRAKFRGVEHHKCLQDHMPGDSPRKLQQLFLETTAQEEHAKQQTYFYDHIAAENARAVVYVNTWYKDRTASVNQMFGHEQQALKKWLAYLGKNVAELTSSSYF